MLNRIKIWRFGLVFILLLYSNNILKAGEGNPVIKEGVLDLTGFNFNSSGNVKLHGEWKFFRDKFIDYKTANINQDFCFLKVPKSWENQNCHGDLMTYTGYGTYFLKIIIDPKFKNEIFYIKTKNISTSSNVYVNNKLVGHNGIPSETKEKAVPDLGMEMNSFYSANDTLYLIIHASNYHIKKSGLSFSIELGLSSKIIKKEEITIAKDLFILGSIFLMMLYYLMLYFIRSKEKSYLYFAITCFSFAFYALCLSKVYFYIFPDINFEWDYKLKRLALYVSLPAMVFYIYHIFKEDFSKLILKIVTYVLVAITLATLIFNSDINTHFITYFRYYGVVIVLYMSYVIVKSIINKRFGAKLFLAGVILIFLSIINDFLFNIEVIRTMDIMPLGMFLFLFTQAYFLSLKFNNAFARSEQLTEELTYINKNLEAIVEERTAQITAQKHEIEEKNEELNQLLEEVTSQRDEIESQRNTVVDQKAKIEVINHEISQSIEYAKRIQSAILSDPSILAKNLSDSFLLFKPKDIVSGDFYWWAEVEGHLIIAAVDCTGHGVPGGFMSMLGISFLREIIVKEYIVHPGLILKKLRKEIINVMKQKGEIGEQKDGMDMVLVSINLNTKLLQFSGANNPMYVVRNGELTEHFGNKMPIAIYEKMDKFDTTDIQLMAGDQLYMFSDGFADQFGGPSCKKFKYKPFKELILMHSDKSMSEQKNIIENTIINWMGMEEQVDDILVLGIKI